MKKGHSRSDNEDSSGQKPQKVDQSTSESLGNSFLSQQNRKQKLPATPYRQIEKPPATSDWMNPQAVEMRQLIMESPLDISNECRCWERDLQCSQGPELEFLYQKFEKQFGVYIQNLNSPSTPFLKAHLQLVIRQLILQNRLQRESLKRLWQLGWGTQSEELHSRSAVLSLLDQILQAGFIRPQSAWGWQPSYQRGSVIPVEEFFSLNHHQIEYIQNISSLKQRLNNIEQYLVQYADESLKRWEVDPNKEGPGHRDKFLSQILIFFGTQQHHKKIQELTLGQYVQLFNLQLKKLLEVKPNSSPGQQSPIAQLEVQWIQNYLSPLQRMERIWPIWDSIILGRRDTLARNSQEAIQAYQLLFFEMASLRNGLSNRFIASMEPEIDKVYGKPIPQESLISSTQINNLSNTAVIGQPVELPSSDNQEERSLQVNQSVVEYQGQLQIQDRKLKHEGKIEEQKFLIQQERLQLNQQIQEAKMQLREKQLIVEQRMQQQRLLIQKDIQIAELNIQKDNPVPRVENSLMIPESSPNKDIMEMMKMMMQQQMQQQHMLMVTLLGQQPQNMSMSGGSLFQQTMTREILGPPINQISNNAFNTQGIGPPPFSPSIMPPNSDGSRIGQLKQSFQQD